MGTSLLGCLVKRIVLVDFDTTEIEGRSDSCQMIVVVILKLQRGMFGWRWYLEPQNVMQLGDLRVHGPGCDGVASTLPYGRIILFRVTTSIRNSRGVLSLFLLHHLSNFNDQASTCISFDFPPTWLYVMRQQTPNMLS
jgi:hypothetical protein